MNGQERTICRFSEAPAPEAPHRRIQPEAEAEWTAQTLQKGSTREENARPFDEQNAPLQSLRFSQAQGWFLGFLAVLLGCVVRAWGGLGLCIAQLRLERPICPSPTFWGVVEHFLRMRAIRRVVTYVNTLAGSGSTSTPVTIPGGLWLAAVQITLQATTGVNAGYSYGTLTKINTADFGAVAQGSETRLYLTGFSMAANSNGFSIPYWAPIGMFFPNTGYLFFSIFNSAAGMNIPACECTIVLDPP